MNLFWAITTYPVRRLFRHYFPAKQIPVERVSYTPPHFAGRVRAAQNQREGVKSYSESPRLEEPKQKQQKKTKKWSGTELEALEVLGMKAPFTQEELKKQRKIMLQKLHPDQGGSDMLVRMVNDAYNILKL